VLPWWLYSFVTMGIVALLGFRHIELSAKILGVALVLEISIVLVMDAVIFARGGDGGIVGATFAPEHVFTGSIGVAVLFALTGFIGFEATAVFRDEARDPERTIPRATYLAVIIIGVFYALSCWAIIIGVGADHAVPLAQKTLAGDGNLMLDTAQRYLGFVAQASSPACCHSTTSSRGTSSRSPTRACCPRGLVSAIPSTRPPRPHRWCRP